MQDGCQVYMNSYVASNGICFMATWTTFKSHLLEVGLTHIQETMALRTLITFGLFMCEDPKKGAPLLKKRKKKCKNAKMQTNLLSIVG